MSIINNLLYGSISPFINSYPPLKNSGLFTPILSPNISRVVCISIILIPHVASKDSNGLLYNFCTTVNSIIRPTINEIIKDDGRATRK